MTLADGSILSQNITNGNGQTIVTATLNTLGDFIYTRSEYNAKGQLTKQYQDTGSGSESTAPTLFEYDAFGNVVKQTLALVATPTKDNSPVVEMAYSVESTDEGVFSLTTNTRYNAEGNPLVSVQKSLISHLSNAVESKNLTIDERNLTSTQWVEYHVGTKRKSYNTLPTSDITAEAVTVDGFTLSQTDNAGVTVTHSRSYTVNGMIHTRTDAQGNQTLVKTSTGTWEVTYDAENRPVSFTNTEAITVIECAYDSMGRRATKKVTVDGNITLHQRYLYRGYLQIACCDLTRDNHPALWLIIWDSTQPIATRPLVIQKDGTWFTYGWDLTKNICELYGTNGYIRAAYTYTPYGEVTTAGDVTQPIQWSSEYNDIELSLVYYNYRHYNPLDGRWIGRDQDKYVYTSMYYTYSKNSPVILLDKYGLYTYVQLDNNMGHGWIRTGGITVNYSVKKEGSNIYHESSWLFEGVGFYPVENSTTKQHDYVFGLPGKWSLENSKEYMYTVSDAKATEYDLKVYKPFYQIEIGDRLFFEGKLQYGNKEKCCKDATADEIKECVTSHPAFKEVPHYYLLMGNCRERAKDILADCCMELNNASARPARKGYVLRRYSESIYEEYGDKSILNLNNDRNSTPLL